MIIVDVFEPIQVEHLIEQSLPVSRVAINSQGYADYLWHDVNGLIIQVERKQIDEILSDMDAVEEQLGREIVKADKTYLLWEGTFEPIPKLNMGCQSFKKSKDGKILVAGHKYNCNYAGVQAWFDRLDKSGITIVNTIDYVATAITLVALYNNQQKPEEEHGTFNRYYKKKIYPKPKNHHVETLMGIKGEDLRLGEKKALALVERYGSVWQVLNQDVEELAQTEGIGKVIATKLLKAVGRYVDG